MVRRAYQVMPQSRRGNTLKRGHQTRLLGVHALACPPRLRHYRIKWPALDAGVRLVLHSERHWPGASEAEYWP